MSACLRPLSRLWKPCSLDIAIYEIEDTIVIQVVNANVVVAFFAQQQDLLRDAVCVCRLWFCKIVSGGASRMAAAIVGAANVTAKAV